MKYVIEQKAKISKQGPQYHINIRKEFHNKLEEKLLLNKDLHVTITFETFD